MRRLDLLAEDESLSDSLTSELAADRFALKAVWSQGDQAPNTPDRLVHAEQMFPSSEDAAMETVIERRLEAAWAMAVRAADAVDWAPEP